MPRRSSNKRAPRARNRHVEEGRVRDLARGGDGVVEMPSGLWFVPGVAPGERVRAREVAGRSGVMRGELLEVMEASPHRVEPECPHHKPCGGCPWMHLSPAHEGDLKRGLLQELLERVGAGDVRAEWVTGESSRGYRTRARMAWDRKGRRTRLGFRRARSHDVTDIPSCLVLHPDLDGALCALRERLLPVLTGQGEVALAFGLGARPVAVLRAGEAQPPEVYDACRRWFESGEVAGVALQVEEAAAATWGAPEEELAGFDGRSLGGTLGGFSQANAGVNALLVGAAVELAETAGASVHELYAGHGNFSVALAPGSADYVAVEQDPAAAARCAENLRARGLSARVVAGDATENLGRGPLDVLVLDPPRTGARGVLAEMATRKPRRIVYVSCDLATLERDLRELPEGQYRIDRALGFEMFPRTSQLETLVRIIRL